MGTKKEKLKKAYKDKLKQQLKDKGLDDAAADQWAVDMDQMTGEESAQYLIEKLRNK